MRNITRRGGILRAIHEAQGDSSSFKKAMGKLDISPAPNCPPIKQETECVLCIRTSTAEEVALCCWVYLENNKYYYQTFPAGKDPQALLNEMIERGIKDYKSPTEFPFSPALLAISGRYSRRADVLRGR